MKIPNERAIDGSVAKQLRLKHQLSQREFWRAVLVEGSTGSSYESGRNNMPAPIRRLVFLHYVVGIPTDTSTKEAKEMASKLAPIARRKESIERVSALTSQAVATLALAQEELNGIRK